MNAAIEAAARVKLQDDVARAIYLAYAQHPEADWRAVDQRMKGSVWLPQADAAIATVMASPEITTLRADNAALREGFAAIADDRFLDPWSYARALLETNHAKESGL